MEAPKKPTLRASRALETRKRLLESALALFRERGFDAVSVDEITKAANTSKGSFYTHFTTKSDIIKEEFRLIDDFYLALLPELEKIEGAADRLRAFSRGQLDYIHSVMGYQNLGIMYMNQLSDFNEEKVLTRRERPLFRITRDLVAYGQGRGEFTTRRPPEELAIWVNRCMRGFFLDWAISRAGIDARTEGQAFFEDFVLPALAAGR